MTTIREMRPSDYAAVRALWERTGGICLNESDTEAAIAAFLARNPMLSSIALSNDLSIVGAVLCGHDGRRGYLHHLAVDAGWRRRGIARQMITRCLAGLAQAGLSKCNLFILADNAEGRAFWLHQGWCEPTWKVMQRAVLTLDSRPPAPANRT